MKKLTVKDPEKFLLIVMIFIVTIISCQPFNTNMQIIFMQFYLTFFIIIKVEIFNNNIVFCSDSNDPNDPISPPESAEPSARPGSSNNTGSSPSTPANPGANREHDRLSIPNLLNPINPQDNSQANARPNRRFHWLSIPNILNPVSRLVNRVSISSLLNPTNSTVDQPVDQPVDPLVDQPVDPPVDPSTNPSVQPPVDPSANPSANPPVAPPVAPPVRPGGIRRMNPLNIRNLLNRRVTFANPIATSSPNTVNPSPNPVNPPTPKPGSSSKHEEPVEPISNDQDGGD